MIQQQQNNLYRFASTHKDHMNVHVNEIQVSASDMCYTYYSNKLSTSWKVYQINRNPNLIYIYYNTENW
jgi:hypothetical protein